MAKAVQLDTSLSEFTYSVAREAPMRLKRGLPDKYFKAISTEKAAMRFATRSSFEEKREFFAYLGIEHFSMFVDTKDGKITDFREVFNRLNVNGSASETLRKLTEANAYVSSNKELCYLLGFSSQTIDTKSYVKNMELVRTGYHLKNFKNKISTPEYSEANEEINISNSFAKYMFSMLAANDLCDEITGVDTPCFRLLLYFYMHRHSYIPHDKLLEVFAGGLSGRKIFAARKKLKAEALIQPHPAQKVKDYTITGKGILVVNQFRERVIKALDF